MQKSIRALQLLAALTEIYLAFVLLWLRRNGRISLNDRATWMHHASRRVAGALHLSLDLAGPVPQSGLIASNHLSYLDILAFAMATPCIFVAKSDVAQWPIFGNFARFGGTLFVNRDSRTAVESASRQIADALRANLPVVLFPEGTSTDGSEVMPFHASLLEPAILSAAPLTAAAVGYQSTSHPESAFCYYGDIHFAEHLPSVLRSPQARMLLRFNPASRQFTNRKEAAQQLRQQTIALREAMQPDQSASHS